MVCAGVALTFFAVDQLENKSNRCKSKGGVVIKTIEGWQCMSMGSGTIL